MKEELKQPKTDIRLWILTVVFCKKKNMFTGFALITYYY